MKVSNEAIFLLESVNSCQSNITTTDYKFTQQFDIDEQSLTLRDRKIIRIANKLELQKIRSFLDLSANWDGDNAQQIDKLVVSKATKFVEELSNYNEDVYFASPGPNGEIMIHLKKRNKEIEAIFYPNKERFVTFENNKFQEQGVFTEDIISELIEWLNINE